MRDEEVVEGHRASQVHQEALWRSKLELMGLNYL